MKYQPESRKLSLTSVSRLDGSPQIGQGTLTQSSTWASGEEHGQLRLGHADGAVDGAVDDRQRRSPVPLSRDDPVAKPELDVAATGAARLEHIDHTRPALRGRRAVERTRVDHGPLPHPGRRR